MCMRPNLSSFTPFDSSVVRVRPGPAGWSGGLADEDGRGDDGRPEALLVADGSLSHVLRADDLVGQPVDFLLLVPALVGVELEAERRREHLGGELLGVVAGNLLALAEAVMLREVPVELPVARD